MLRSLGLGLGLETFAKFLRVSVSVPDNLVSEKKSRFRFRKIWYQKKSLGIGFGQNFGIVIQCPGDILIISIIKIIIIMYLIIQKENQETKTIMVVGM